MFLLTKKKTPQVCEKVKAKFLIDDSLENALKCVLHPEPTPTLLFGYNEWNKRESKYRSDDDSLSHEQRLQKEGGREFWKDDETAVPEGVPLYRVKDWTEVIQWVEAQQKEGKL